MTPTEADQPTTELEQALTRAIEESKAYEPCMALEVCEEGKAVSLYLDTAASTYSEWIPGEGGDIGLIRCQETKRVMGVRLPLYRNNLVVSSKGPIRINEGFRKGEPQDARQPTEADKAAARAIIPTAVTYGSQTPNEWIRDELKRREDEIAHAAKVIAQHMAPERAEAAKVKGELEATRSLLFDIEVALTNSHPGCHPECDKGVCTHPLKLVRQALAATKPYTTEVT